VSSYRIAQWQKPEGSCEIVHQVRDGHSLETWLTGYVVFDKDPTPGECPFADVTKFHRPGGKTGYGMSYPGQSLHVFQVMDDLNRLYDMLIERRTGCRLSE